MPDAGPAAICKTPGATSTSGWFTDITHEMGLDTPPPPAVGVIAADFDGDGWADLVTLAGSAERGIPDAGLLAGVLTRHILMNRPSPQHPQERILVDVTQESGVLATRDGQGMRGFNLANAGDLNNDGFVDLILCSADALSATYVPLDACDAFLNDGTAHFTLAASSDLNASVFWVPGGALLDYDRDGVLDFWPATIAHWPYDPNGPNNQPPTLFHGNGDGTFTNGSANALLPTHDGTAAHATQWRHVFGVTACDLNGDGADDMVFASYGRQENQVWLNDGFGTFEEVAHAWGLDHDDRTNPVDDQSYRCFCQANPSQCPAHVPAPSVAQFCGVFGGMYGRGWSAGAENVPSVMGGNNFSFACGDIDDDGDMDLMSATIVHGDVGDSADPTELILNPGDGGVFVRPGNETNGLVRPETGIYWNHGDDMVVLWTWTWTG